MRQSKSLKGRKLVRCVPCPSNMVLQALLAGLASGFMRRKFLHLECTCAAMTLTALQRLPYVWSLIRGVGPMIVWAARRAGVGAWKTLT